MSMLWVLGLVLLMQAATASIVVVPEYNKASPKAQQLVTKIVDDYSTFSVLQLLKNIPGVDTSKCVSAKEQYINNLKLLLEETKIAPPTGGEKEFEIDSVDGKLVLPYIAKKENAAVTCQKILDVNVAQQALKKHIAMKYQQALNVMSKDGLENIKKAVSENPQVLQVVNTLNQQLTSVMSSVTQNPQVQQLLSVVTEQAANINKVASMVTESSAYKGIKEQGTQWLTAVMDHPQVQQARTVIGAQLERSRSFGVNQVFSFFNSGAKQSKK